MRRLLLSFVVLGITSLCSIGATTAYFSDTEVSSGNTFTAGTLDLKIDGGDVNVSKSFSNLSPLLSQPNWGYSFHNAGTIDGVLNISGVSILDYENGCLDPESFAGDTSCGDLEGELSQALNIRVWVDSDWNWEITPGESVLYNGPLSGLSVLDIKGIGAGETIRVGMLVTWDSNAYIQDNLAQGDSLTVDFTFTLEQVH